MPLVGFGVWALVEDLRPLGLGTIIGGSMIALGVVVALVWLGFFLRFFCRQQNSESTLN